MADENISILIQDKVSPSISTKLKAIAATAREGDAAVKNLQAALAALNTGALNVITQGATNATRALQQTTIQAQRLATEQQRTAAATAQAAAAQTRANTAITQGTTAQANLATATQRTLTAQQQTATAAQRLATEQQRTAVQTANAAAANDRAALATLRLKQAQEKAAVSTGNLSTRLLSLRNVLSVIVSALGLKAFANVTSEMTDLESRINRVAGSAEAGRVVFSRLNKMARRTYSDFNLTAESFLGSSTALQELGYSTKQSLDFTESLNNALVISGAKAERAAQVQDALSKAMALGVLRGQNLNSVIQVGGRVAELLAEQMGVGVNQLRKLGEQGKITGNVIFNALAGNLKKTREEADKMPATVNDGFLLISNAVKKSIRDFDEMTGISKKVADALIWIADNMKVVALATAVTGAGLITYFGPSLLKMLAAATKAVFTFTVAIATNPIGLLVVGITAAIAAIVLFGDKLKVSSDGLVTLKDVAIAVWSYITDAIKVVSDLLKSVWGAAIDWVNEKTDGWGEQFRNVGSFIMKVGKTYANFQIGVWVAAYNGIKIIWNNFPAIMQGFFASVVNLGAAAVELLVNSWQAGLRGIAKLAESIAPDMSKSLTSALDSLKVELPRMDVSDSAKDAAKEFKKAVSDAFSRDYMGEAGSAIMNRARQQAEARNAANKNKNLLGGDNVVKQNEELSKSGERRALALEKINTQLDNEIKRMFVLRPQREAQAKLDQIEESLIQKKIKLTEQERAAIMDKILAVQQAQIVQQKFDEIYEEATGAQRDFNAVQEAATRLLNIGAISQEQYSRSVLKASEALANANDPMRQYNKDLQQQFDLLKLLPKQREVEQQIMQVQNDLLTKGIVLNEQELAQLREKLTLLQQLNAVSQQEAQLLDNSVNKRQGFIDQLTAINKLLADRNSGFTKGDALTALGGSDIGQFLLGSPEMVSAQVEQFENMYSQIDALRQADIISEQTAAAAKMQIWNAQQDVQLQSAQTFFGGLAQLQNSSNKRLAAVGKAAAITQAIINTYQSATGAYAAMASIPYVGPGLGAAAAAAAIAAGMANVAQIRAQGTTGYMTGGYTGSGAQGQIAGVVHGQEFVMNASTTSRVGVANLQALQSGAATIQGGPSTGKGGSSVGNGGNEQSTNVQVPVKIVNVIDPQEALNALNSAAGERLILNTIERNPNTVRKLVS